MIENGDIVSSPTSANRMGTLTRICNQSESGLLIVG